MASVLVELRPRPDGATRPAAPLEEISPELALVCPETRRLATAQLPDRDPYAFLEAPTREPPPAEGSTSPEATDEVVTVFERPELRLVVEAARARPAEPSSIPAPATPVPRERAPVPEPAPAAAELEPEGAAEPPPREESAGFASYVARELLMLAIAAVLTLGGLASAMTIVDVLVR